MYRFMFSRGGSAQAEQWVPVGLVWGKVGETVYITFSRGSSAQIWHPVTVRESLLFVPVF